MRCELDAADALLKAEPALIGERTGLGETSLHYLAVENQLAAASLLMDAGADVNARAIFDRTPLHLAAETGAADIARCLLDHGADRAARDACGGTAAEAAAEKGALGAGCAAVGSRGTISASTAPVTLRIDAFGLERKWQ